jgi:hypothetical protein
VPLLQEILECGEEKLITEEVNNKKSLATDVKVRTAWQMAMRYSYVDLLQQIWEWAREKITTEEINNILLFASGNKGSSVWHVVAN